MHISNKSFDMLILRCDMMHLPLQLGYLDRINIMTPICASGSEMISAVQKSLCSPSITHTWQCIGHDGHYIPVGVFETILLNEPIPFQSVPPIQTFLGYFRPNDFSKQILIFFNNF